jgi:hypothetical protein
MAAQRDRNPALYDCHRCIGYWLAAGQNASTAVGNEKQKGAAAAG